MKCPRDHAELNIRQREGVVGQVCKTCQGIFLTSTGVKLFKVNHQTDVLENIPETCLQVKAKTFCPNCYSKMSLVKMDDIEIDVCSDCTGIWFDKNEASKIAKNYNPNTPRDENGWYLFFEAVSLLLSRPC